MHILICGSTYFPQLNGQAIFTRGLAEGMAACGHEVHVLAPSVPGHSHNAVLNGVNIIRLPSMRLKIVSKDLYMPVRFARTVVAQLDTFRPDVVHLQDPSPVCRTLMRAARRRGIPTVVTHHPGPEITAPYLTTANPIVRQVCTYLCWRFVLRHLAQAELVTVPSRASAEMLRNMGLRTQVLTVPCFVQLDDFKPRPDLDSIAVRHRYGLDPEGILILYIGRIDIEKRVDVLIRAMADLAHPGTQLAIAGHGTQEPDMRRLADALGLSDRIRFLSSVGHAEIPALIQSADIFAMPGDAESFSIATLEAMACGKPVLATASPALSELIEHKTTGYLFQPRQAHDAADGIRTLLQSRAEWPQMGALNVKKAGDYGVERVMHSYERAYRRAGEALPDAWTVTAFTRIPEVEKLGRLLPRAALLLAGLAMALTSLILTPDPMQASAELRIDDLGPVNIVNVATLPAIDPHPVGEILGDDGLVQAVLEDGAKVRVVIVTNGDGQLTGPIVMGNSTRADSADDNAKLGEEWQKELSDTVENAGASESSGEDESVVVLLGYPKGKLGLLWESEWQTDTDIQGKFTRAAGSH